MGLLLYIGASYPNNTKNESPQSPMQIMIYLLCLGPGCEVGARDQGVGLVPGTRVWGWCLGPGCEVGARDQGVRLVPGTRVWGWDNNCVHLNLTFHAT